ncbi:hydrogenase expression/formation protein HypD [Klebsiella michiganensis]|uniref:hydrogenase expression/formation protein HypD n=1 Tax=Klebsiella michiganensis TaxID=1134687 RepID=UPI00294A465B|nr:hydrogenase expression/formation protein HypD [Klebsiella michiganensis]MDV5448779.1 hydrogenase expression/formation protein HypD [Klebsiella michiganensis]
MKINIKDAPSRSETIIRNIAYAVRATAIMTEYYLRSFPVVFFYVLIGFALAFDSSEVPLTTLLQQGMLTNILTCSVLGNLLWLGVNLALRGTPFSKNCERLINALCAKSYVQNDSSKKE